MIDKLDSMTFNLQYCNKEIIDMKNDSVDEVKNNIIQYFNEFRCIINSKEKELLKQLEIIKLNNSKHPLTINIINHFKKNRLCLHNNFMKFDSVLLSCLSDVSKKDEKISYIYKECKDTVENCINTGIKYKSIINDARSTKSNKSQLYDVHFDIKFDVKNYINDIYNIINIDVDTQTIENTNKINTDNNNNNKFNESTDIKKNKFSTSINYNNKLMDLKNNLLEIDKNKENILTNEKLCNENHKKNFTENNYKHEISIKQITKSKTISKKRKIQFNITDPINDNNAVNSKLHNNKKQRLI